MRKSGRKPPFPLKGPVAWTQFFFIWLMAFAPAERRVYRRKRLKGETAPAEPRVCKASAQSVLPLKYLDSLFKSSFPLPGNNFYKHGHPALGAGLALRTLFTHILIHFKHVVSRQSGKGSPEQYHQQEMCPHDSLTGRFKPTWLPFCE